MIITSIIIGWSGILLFIIIVSTFKKLAKRNEYAFLHVLMTWMYAMWLPLPFALYQLLNIELLLIGTIFGSVYLIMLVFAMALQAGHIAYTVKHNDDHSISVKHGEYIMSTLSNPFEALAKIFKCIWALFLGISFWNNAEVIMALAMFLSSGLFFHYLLIVMEKSLVQPINFLAKIKPNQIFVHIETFLFFSILLGYMTYKLYM